MLLTPFHFYLLVIALNLHFCAQAPHFIHFSLSTTCAFLTSPEIAFTGHAFEQAVQPIHFSGSMWYLASAVHTPAGQVLS
jgi:hypothetical protein